MQNSVNAKRIVTVASGVLLLLLAFKYCTFKKNGPEINGSQLIQEQLKNVGKLVVVEGHFSEVYTYKDNSGMFSYLPFLNKKALVVANAEATVSFDLRQLEYVVDAENKVVTITKIPSEEIKVYPTLKYYDVEQSVFNEFTADDYNKIQKEVTAKILGKVKKSSFGKNAQNRLLSELNALLVVTREYGYTLVYEGESVSAPKELQD